MESTEEWKNFMCIAFESILWITSVYFVISFSFFQISTSFYLTSLPSYLFELNPTIFFFPWKCLMNYLILVRKIARLWRFSHNNKEDTAIMTNNKRVYMSSINAQIISLIVWSYNSKNYTRHLSNHLFER